ncbi:MAG: hypothetical protein ACKVVP_23305 [Chloroflexota bacterium]
MKALLESSARPPFHVTSVQFDRWGGLRVVASGKLRIDVFPATSVKMELWRLFEPGHETAHFVMHSSGASWE